MRLYRQVPKEWQDTLNYVREYFPGAIIAGGALRDWFNDRPVKDVDIFIPVEPSTSFIGEPLYDLEDHCDKIRNMFSGADLTLDVSCAYGVKTKEDDDRDIFAIFRLVRGDTKYDLIICQPGACDITKFDINICQISYNGTAIRATDAFHTGVTEKKLELMNVNRTDRNAARLERMKIKYPDFEVVNG